MDQEQIKQGLRDFWEQKIDDLLFEQAIANAKPSNVHQITPKIIRRAGLLDQFTRDFPPDPDNDLAYINAYNQIIGPVVFRSARTGKSLRLHEILV